MALKRIVHRFRCIEQQQTNLKNKITINIFLSAALCPLLLRIPIELIDFIFNSLSFHFCYANNYLFNRLLDAILDHLTMWFNCSWTLIWYSFSLCMPWIWFSLYSKMIYQRYSNFRFRGKLMNKLLNWTRNTFDTFDYRFWSRTHILDIQIRNSIKNHWSFLFW